MYLVSTDSDEDENNNVTRQPPKKCRKRGPGDKDAKTGREPGKSQEGNNGKRVSVARM